MSVVTQTCVFPGTESWPSATRELLNEIVQHGQHSRLVARYLFAMDTDNSLIGVAARIEHCGRRAKLKKCDTGHITEKRFACERHFACKHCSERRVDELLVRYHPVFQLLRERRERGTFIEVTKRVGRSLPAMRAFHESVTRRLRRLIGPAAALWTLAVGFDGDTAIIRILFQSQYFDQATIESKLSGGQLTKLERSHNTEALFRDQFLKLWRPSDPYDQAEHEKLFNRYHRMRASGIPYDFSVYGTSTQSLTEMSHTTPHRHTEKCRVCALPITSESESFDITASIEEKRALRWYPKRVIPPPLD